MQPPLVTRIWQVPPNGNRNIGATHRNIASNIYSYLLITEIRTVSVFIIQSKWSLHRLSIETRNTGLANLGQSCINQPRYIRVWKQHIRSETLGFLLSKCYFHNEWSNNLYKTLKCMFCGVTQSDWSRNIVIKHQACWHRSAVPFQFHGKFGQCILDRSLLILFDTIRIHIFANNTHISWNHKYLGKITSFGDNMSAWKSQAFAQQAVWGPSELTMTLTLDFQDKILT